MTRRIAWMFTCSALVVGCAQKPTIDGDAMNAAQPGADQGGGDGTPDVVGEEMMPTAPEAALPSGDSTEGEFIGGDGTEKPDCTPVSCQELGFDCGQIEDGCGALISCGMCPDGFVCGAGAPNVCLDPLTLTVPVPMTEACASKQCGDEGNGRGGTYTCGQCSAEEVCGVLENFQCAPLHPPCTAASSCTELGWACGIAFDDCGNTFDCAAEGRMCNALSTCTGGLNGPTTCESSQACTVCDAIPDCSAAPTLTSLTGRVITPGRDDTNTPNQVGVPNAYVYILATSDAADLPAVGTGIPEGEMACDRCDGQALGPVLVGAPTDALGNFKLEGDVPVGKEFLLVVKVGKFRRAVPVTLPDTAACAETALERTNTRLPRTMTDGVGVNIPRIAVSTGDIDAMECVLEKMGVAASEFDVGDATNAARVHLYGTDGAEMPAGNPPETDLHGDLARLTSYDMLVFDCQGQGYLNPPDAADIDNVREYVNRGGRMFASHLSYQWICRSGDTPYSADAPIETGLAPSADFPTCEMSATNLETLGTGVVSVGRPNANPDKIQNFADWLVNENAATLGADGSYTFDITDPRDLAAATGAFPGSEEFVYRSEDDTVQQYSFNTPYAAPAEAVCGRVAYSGFHVAASDSGGGMGMGMGMGVGFGGGFANAVFPEHCAGDLTAQEKVLLYMLFDLGACIGDPPDPPSCDPIACADLEAECGFIGDGCGQIVDCGPCPEGQVCGVVEPNKCSGCQPLACADVGAECGVVGDGCGATVDCGPCPPGELCGILTPYVCDPPPPCPPLVCEKDDCGQKGDGCGGVIECGKCPDDDAR